MNSSDGQTQGVGGKDRLTSAEWSTYISDAQYVRDLTKPNVPVHLNLADPRQYNLAMMRLKLAGKSATNSPYLFELIDVIGVRRAGSDARRPADDVVVHHL